MAGKKNTKKAGGMRRHFEPDKEKTAAEYYELHTGAVNDLVEADESNSPEVSPRNSRSTVPAGRSISRKRSRSCS